MSIISEMLQSLANNSIVRTANTSNSNNATIDFDSTFRDALNSSAQSSSPAIDTTDTTISDLYQQPGVVGNPNSDTSIFGGYSNTKDHILNSNLDAATKQAYSDLLKRNNARLDFASAVGGSPVPYARDVDVKIDAAIDAGLKPGSTYNTNDYANFSAAFKKYFPKENLTSPPGTEVTFGSSKVQVITDPRVSDYFEQNAGNGPWNGKLMAMYREIIG